MTTERLHVPTPLDVAEDNYTRSLEWRRANCPDWWEATQDFAGDWHVTHFGWTTHEYDTNVTNWEERESLPPISHMAALLVAHAANKPTGSTP